MHIGARCQGPPTTMYREVQAMMTTSSSSTGSTQASSALLHCGSAVVLAGGLRLLLLSLLLLWSTASGATTQQIRRSICVSFHAIDGLSNSSSPQACAVNVHAQISHNPCVQGHATNVSYDGTTYHYPNGTFGVDCAENKMWVIGGCRADFVCGAAGGGGGHTSFECSSESYTEREYCALMKSHGCAVVPPPPPSPPQPPMPPGPDLPVLPAGMRTYLLLDSRNVISTVGRVRMVLGNVGKDAANPVLREDKPWEMRFDNMQPSVWFDPDLQVWRCWYNSFSRCGPRGYAATHDCQRGASDCTRDNTAAYDPHLEGSQRAGSSGREGVMCTATSANGTSWSKPNLGLVKWGATRHNVSNASTDNNIIIDFAQAGINPWGIYRDEAAHAAERWKAFGMLGETQMITAVSADGLRWQQRRVPAGTEGKFDTHANVLWDPTTQKWVGHARCTPTVDTHGRSEGGSHHARVQCYTESQGADYADANWSQFEPSGLNSSNDYQPDALVVFRYAGIYLGFANIFNPFLHTGARPGLPGTVNMELCWSTDARRWRYVAPGRSFVPHVPGSGDWDCCGVFGAKQSPEHTHEFRRGARQLPLFYAGCNGRFFSSRSCSLGRALVGRHAFAGFKGPGTVQVAPAKVSTGELRVTATGGVRVGVFEGDHKLQMGASTVVDGVEVPVTWENRTLAQYLRGAVGLLFDIPAGAVLYAYHM